MKMTVRNRKWIAALLALMMALCGVSALAENGEETAAQTEEAATQTEVVATQTEEAEPVLLATVNGEEIRSDNAAMRLVGRVLRHIRAHGTLFSPEA